MTDKAEEERYNLIVKDYLDTIMNLDPDISPRMKSHYKKQFIKITEGETSENLVFKLCKKISDLEDEVKATRQNYYELKQDVKQYKITIDAYKQKQDHFTHFSLRSLLSPVKMPPGSSPGGRHLEVKNIGPGWPACSRSLVGPIGRPRRG